MRTIQELENLLDWTNDEDYHYLMQQKYEYLKHPDMDTFCELQSLALAIYSDAKYAFSCNCISLDELHMMQNHILEGLWHPLES